MTYGDRIKAAAKGRNATRNTTLTRAQIELAGELCRMDDALAREVAKRHFHGDDRHWHIAMFTNRQGATAFMRELVERLELA